MQMNDSPEEEKGADNVGFSPTTQTTAVETETAEDDPELDLDDDDETDEDDSELGDIDASDED